MSEQEFTFDAAQVGDSGTIGAIVKAELDQQISTAKAYPRSLQTFKQNAIQWAQFSQEVAEECFYQLKRKDRDGKIVLIEGPSARLAEIVYSTWGNCMAGARIVAEEDGFVVAQGIFRDLQFNTAISYEVRRSVRSRSGKRYSDDMVSVTANAACAIALRNAVFKGIPKALWHPVYIAARKAAAGDEKTHVQRRDAALKYVKDQGVTEAALFATLGVKGMEDIDSESLLTLRGLLNAVKEGDATLADVFEDPNAVKPAKGESAGPAGTVGAPGSPGAPPTGLDTLRAAVGTPDTPPQTVSGDPSQTVQTTAGVQPQTVSGPAPNAPERAQEETGTKDRGKGK